MSDSNFVVAFYVPHNEGVVTGIIDGPNQEGGSDLIDLYEVDMQIRSFSTRRAAEQWLSTHLND